MLKFGFVLCAVLAFLALCQGLKVENRAESVVDELLQVTNRQIRYSAQQLTLIPSINENFTVIVKRSPVQGEFKTSGGWLKDFATLKRNGAVKLKSDKGAVSFGFPFHMNEMTFGFDEYTAAAFPLNINGKIDVSVGENNFYMRFTVQKTESGCKTKVDNVEVTDLGQFNVEMIEFEHKEVGFIYDFVVKFITKIYSGQVTTVSAVYLEFQFALALHKVDMCKLLKL